MGFFSWCRQRSKRKTDAKIKRLEEVLRDTHDKIRFLEMTKGEYLRREAEVGLLKQELRALLTEAFYKVQHRTGAPLHGEEPQEEGLQEEQSRRENCSIRSPKV
jgi:hypothetical protein